MKRVVCLVVSIFGSLLLADEPKKSVVQDVVSFGAGLISPGQDEAAMRDLPIGVFDSGIGGLTVLEAILGLDGFRNDTLQPGADGRGDFEAERFVYLGDQANMPYGNYSAAGKTDFLRELILRDALFLLGRSYHSAPGGSVMTDKPPVKAIVIACNTATAYGLEDIRAAVAAWKIPVIVVGVVEAGARGVAESLPREMGAAGVGVLATVGTCATGAYPRSIASTSGQAGKSAPVVLQQGSVGLAGAIEGDPGFIVSGDRGGVAYLGPVLDSPEGYDSTGLVKVNGSWQINSVANYIRYDLLGLLKQHRTAGATVPISRLVLGCTHFPLVAKEIQTAVTELRAQGTYTAQLAESLELVNPAELTAKELFRGLAKAKLRRTGAPAGEHLFFISVPNPGAPGVKLDVGGRLERGYQYARDLGNPGREDTVVVKMKPEALPKPSRQLLEEHLPKVWQALLRN